MNMSFSLQLLKKRCQNIRKNIIKLSYQYGWVHLGSALSCTDILTVLYFRLMEKEDRLILSKGHAAMALYSILLKKGKLTEKQIGKLNEHPDKNLKLGIYCSTGSLGHGLAIGLGMALAGKRTFVIMSDGEMDEGSNWEAIKIATDYKIKITAIIDFNRFQAYRKITYNPEILATRLKSFGWVIKIIDGHNCEEIITALKSLANKANSAIIAKTVKGKGVPFLENKLSSHYFKLDNNSAKQALRALNKN